MVKCSYENLKDHIPLGSVTYLLSHKASTTPIHSFYGGMVKQEIHDQHSDEAGKTWYKTIKRTAVVISEGAARVSLGHWHPRMVSPESSRVLV